MFGFLSYYLDENRRIFLYENSVWNIKGRYETAMEDDDEAMWMEHDGDDVMRILVVSLLLFTLLLFSFLIN
jgi:hypothetical protein